MIEIEIDERPKQLSAWTSEPGAERLDLIESDIRRLIREVAEANAVRSEVEKQHATDTKRLLLSIVETVDAFDRVFRNIRDKEDRVTPQMKIWVGNFRTVRRLLESVLSTNGVVQIESLDRSFDPTWHRVSEIVVDPSKPDGTILEEVVKGYFWKNQVLRKSEVVVARVKAE